MTHPALIERITRSLAYMLRHQPEKFGLRLDSHGFGEVNDVVAALSDKLGEPIEPRDLEEAITAGDRPRYEIRGTAVRALYGHSIEVEPGEPSQPPEFLYVGIDSRDATRATQFGLRGGRRRFLHLALNIEDAREAGRRAGREYAIVRIYALDAWEDGVNFYDRRALFLAEQIPTQFLEVLETHNDGYEPQLPTHDDRGPARFEHGGRREQHGRGPRRSERGPGRRDDRRGDRDREPRRTTVPAEMGAPQFEERAPAHVDEPRGEPVREERREPARAERHEHARPERHERGEPRGGHSRGDSGHRQGFEQPRGDRPVEERPREFARPDSRPDAHTEPTRHAPSRDAGRPGGERDRGGPREERHERFDRPRREERAPHAAPAHFQEPRRDAAPSAPQRTTAPPSHDSSFGEGIFDSSAPARPAPKPAPPPAPEPPAARPKRTDDLSDFGAGI